MVRVYCKRLANCFHRMCEPSPPAIQPHASGNITMVGVGIKLEEALGDGDGVRESQQSSPLCDWSSRLPAERGDPEKSMACSTQSPLVRMMLALYAECI